MDMQVLTGEDTSFLAQQSESDVELILGQMAMVMHNITDLQQDTNDKVAQIENQNWFKRMVNTLFGKNKATRQEIQKNNDKVVTYISQAVAQLFNMNLINERIICSLGNRLNEVYLQVTAMNQELLNAKNEILEIKMVQQQTLEALGSFVDKLNAKIESIDNYHMLIQEIKSGVYNDSSCLYSLCSILSQLDKRQVEDNRKMNLLKDSLKLARIINDDEISLQQYLDDIISLPQEKIGLIYLELSNYRNSFPSNLFLQVIENYHFLSKLERMSKNKGIIIQRILNIFELDSDSSFTTADIAETFIENKRECFVSVEFLHTNDNPQIATTQPQTNEPDTITEEEFWEKLDGISDEEDFAISKYYAEKGYPFAQWSLGNDFHDGVGVAEDIKDAVFWYQKAAEQGYDKAQFDLGFIYYSGQLGEVDYQQAVYWFRKAAEQENADGQCALGNCYYNGDGVDIDIDQAVFWYNKAIEQDHDYAMFYLAKYYYHFVDDTDQAIYWYKRAAELGNDHAMCELANIYYMELDDDAKAIYWYEKAAELGNIEARCELGSIYYYKSDNCVLAIFWYTTAAELGSVKAMCELGSMYCEDMEDYEQAIYWYKKAAELGDEDAKLELERIYYEIGEADQ